jgi:AbrB family looped-hinge helix DNA binding protein
MPSPSFRESEFVNPTPIKQGSFKKPLEAWAFLTDNFRMKATTIDRKNRMTLPESIRAALGLKPKDRVEWRVEDGEIRGRRLAVQRPREPFPRGSLRKHLTKQRDKDQLAILASCVQGPVETK